MIPDILLLPFVIGSANILLNYIGRADVQYSGWPQIAEIKKKEYSRSMLFDIHFFYVIFPYKHIDY